MHRFEVSVMGYGMKEDNVYTNLIAMWDMT